MDRRYAGSLRMLFLCVFLPASSLQTITALYGDTIKVPCNPGGVKPASHMFTKWKYDIPDSAPGDLLVKQAHMDEVTIQATGFYKDRVSMGNDSSLLISRATLEDQKTFTCMEVGPADIKEYSTNVLVYSEYSGEITANDLAEGFAGLGGGEKPSAPQIKDKVKELENGKLTAVGECVALNANPPANITWFKNDTQLTDDGKLIVITVLLKKDPTTGLTTTSSKLQYTAVKQDVYSTFTCTIQHPLGPVQVSAPEKFTVIYPTETVDLQVVNKGSIKEGDNVTLKCKADGNPRPTSFNFHLKASALQHLVPPMGSCPRSVVFWLSQHPGCFCFSQALFCLQGKKVTVDNTDTYALTDVTRNSTGEYKCSPVNNDKMVGSKNIVVHYLDVSLNPSGKIIKNVEEALEVQMQKNASADVKVSWTKDNEKLGKQPVFTQLKYSDSGVYECEVSVEGITKKRSFQLVVEGKPVIKKLDKKRGDEGKHKVLMCEAEGSPKPTVQWSINGTYVCTAAAYCGSTRRPPLQEESPYINGKITHKITVLPRENLTVTCMVSNKLGADTKEILVSSLFEEERGKQKGTPGEGEDQAKLIVGIVVGLILAAMIVGIIYWIYQKKSKQGSWKTGEKERGTSEESKKLEENNHKPEV
ncbi:CD166 antigen A precursor-like [Scleropages formosus]|uniref:CD166 antigen A-like n=1 Tax=Scleropages formosus TaxID=113540 RepID=A0A0P7XKD2_SCLFO|nr:CD166 antigen A precursor-like [Scleropages formosus]